MILSPELVERIDRWMQEAAAVEPSVPDAMQVATVDERGRPSLRTVLLKSWDADGLVFFTNYHSRKAQQLDASGVAAVLLHCKGNERQLIAEGPVTRVSDLVSDAYFATRPRGSQIGAWASLQSEVLPSRSVLEERVVELEQSFAGSAVPRPPHWGGYRLRPERLEFWQGLPSRLHVREVFVAVAGGWQAQTLYP